MMRLMMALGVATMSVGCASIVNESNQPVKVETKTAEGNFVTGAECRLTNDYGSVTTKSGDTAQVHRSNKDLDIVCKDPANPEATGRAISRANAGLAGNILIGGGIGAIVDHSRGTAYTYPTWVQLVFGKTLVFDRRAQQDGQPVQGTEPAAVK